MTKKVAKADTFEAALLQAPEKHWFLKRLVPGMVSAP